jgi:hypothetical protein
VDDKWTLYEGSFDTTIYRYAAHLCSVILSYAQLCSATAQTALCLLIALVLLLHFHPQENKYSICEATWF